MPGADGTRLVWTGAALIAAADTDPPPLDHTRYAPSTLWRLGCGCDDCLAWHNADSRERRRVLADAAFPEQRRQQVLELVAAGDVASIEQAAERAQVTPGMVFGLARRDDAFRAALDEAAMALVHQQRLLRPALWLPVRLPRDTVPTRAPPGQDDPAAAPPRGAVSRPVSPARGSIRQGLRLA
ncbi:hypothetical protein AB0D37_40125 [Streptomyces sp. NPDC048384]|uniref:hypothetical protein n=1 Tax=Streptomyces sp. NPDC048384 TaxID=3155487 RepID=UPI003434C3F2